MKKKQVLVFSLIIGTLFGGCVARRATLKTFIDPSIQSTSIKTVAVFAMRNTAFSPGETMEMDRTITQAFNEKNPSVAIFGTTKSDELINKENLVPDYTAFLGEFETSGLPNLVFLNKLKSLFKIDAILQGRLSEIEHRDAGPHMHAQSSLTVRYTLLSTTTGRILWEGTSHAVVEYGKTKGRFAPPFYEVATLAQEKIIRSVPLLGK